MKLSDLKDLRVMKKGLSPEPEDKPRQNQPRKRSVELRSKDEEHARNKGLVMGQKVRMMDTNDAATITGFGKGYYELELDGLTIRPVRSEFIPVDPDDDRKLRASIPSRVKKQEDSIEFQEDTTGDLTVDLHIERIPGNEVVIDLRTLNPILRRKGHISVKTSGYGKYAGSYAQDVAGLDDKTIDDAFEGDPDAYWNID